MSPASNQSMIRPNWQVQFRSSYSNRAARRGRRRRKYQPLLQTLETRSLLSISPAGVTIMPTEQFDFTGAVATFTATDAGPFDATIDWGDGTTDAGTIAAN